MNIDSKREFLGFFERCDKLVSYWSKWQASQVFIFYLIWPFFFWAGEGVGFYLWIAHMLLLLPFALFGFFRAKSLNRTFRIASKMISRHPNEGLVSVFKKVPRIITTILVLELFLPLIWIVSFPLKFLFYKNMCLIKTLIIDRKNLD